MTALRSTRVLRRSATLATFMFWLPYCGGQTRGTPTEFDLAVTASSISGDPRRFETASGWSITVERAELLLGPIWFYGGGRRAELTPWRLGPSVAFAHPSDETFDRGPILSEVLVQHAVDLLATEPTNLGRLEGIEGQLATLELQLRPPGYGPQGVEATSLDQHTFRVIGVAERGDVRVSFVAEGDLPEADQVIESIDADIALDGRPGRLVIEVVLDEWLGLVDFGSLTALDDEGRYVFGPEQQPTAALHRGLRSRFAYRIRWSPR